MEELKYHSLNKIRDSIMSFKKQKRSQKNKATNIQIREYKLKQRSTNTELEEK